MYNLVPKKKTKALKPQEKPGAVCNQEVKVIQWLIPVLNLSEKILTVYLLIIH